MSIYYSSSYRYARFVVRPSASITDSSIKDSTQVDRQTHASIEHVSAPRPYIAGNTSAGSPS
jgi:hypothetical protein